MDLHILQICNLPVATIYARALMGPYYAILLFCCE